MNIWTSKRWKKVYAGKSVRSGIRLSIEKNVDPEVRRAIKEFTAWMRERYSFPIRVRVYVKSSERIKAQDGDMVCGTILLPDSLYVEPYIRLATGDYNNLEAEIGKDNALAAIICCLIHEVTHYYQWINCVTLTEIGIERQATAYTSIILDEYALTREYP